MSAKEIHDLGLKEVARIHAEMRKIQEKVGFKGDLQAFFNFMRRIRSFACRATSGARQISGLATT